jgi:hypothetical protein
MCILENLNPKMNAIAKKIAILVLGFAIVMFSTECLGQPKTDNSVRLIDNKVTYEVPMAYELMHIAMALTDTSIKTDGYSLYSIIIDTSSTYYKEVMKHFGNLKGHSFIQQLNAALKKTDDNYIYNLKLAYNSTDSGKAFKDFANVSNFEQFYNQHIEYYTAVLKEVQQNANVSEQQIWLEKEFPKRYDSYNIVISPLMFAYHFTTRSKKEGKDKCFMWVSRFIETKKYSATVNAGSYIGIVMTEIDHNYVNPVSDKYKSELNSLMGKSNRPKWVDGSISNTYKTGYEVFNEYMTHAVYLLFTNQKLNADDQKIIENSKINGMQKRRRFVKFAKFYEELKQVYQNRKPTETIADLYPRIIEWCKAENAK